jgi:hypothetical protein
MPTLNNYTYTNITYIVPEDSNVSVLFPTAVITIEPLPGYSASAANFSLDPSVTYPEIQSVVFTQSGVNVICTVTFDENFVMPPNNYIIPLCIIAEGTISLISVGGVITFIDNTNGHVTGDINPTYTYNSEGVLNENELVFSLSYTAESGYFLDANLYIAEGNQNNYNVVQIPTYNIDGFLIEMTFNVYYTYPNYSSINDSWVVKVGARELYVNPIIATSYNFDDSFILRTGETRLIDIFGSSETEFSIVMTDSLGNTYPIETDAVIDSTGVYKTQIVFPDASDQLADIVYTISLTGDIDPAFALSNPIVVTQYVSQPTISITGSSLNGITGYTTESSQGNAFDVPSNLFITADWTLTSSTGSINYLGNIDETNFKFTQSVGSNTSVVNSVSNSPTVEIGDATGIAIGDKFNINQDSDSNTAPFMFEITDVAVSTLTVTPNITIEAGNFFSVYRTNGNIIGNIDATAIQVDSSTVSLSLSVQVLEFGDDDITFTLDIDEVIEYAPIISCGSTSTSGGPGITDQTINLDPAGGLLAFLVNAQGVPDKFEIIHGTNSGTKVATSGMDATSNDGPFDDLYGTEAANTLPTSSQTIIVDQFIGSSKGAIATRQTEFNAATGYTIPTMTVGGTTYQQVLWWEYTPSDYVTNPLATIRTTGPDETAWDLLRVCCPDGNCI